MTYQTANRLIMVKALSDLYGVEASQLTEFKSASHIKGWVGRHFTLMQQLSIYKYIKSLG